MSDRFFDALRSSLCALCELESDASWIADLGVSIFGWHGKEAFFVLRPFFPKTELAETCFCFLDSTGVICFEAGCKLRRARRTGPG